MTMKAIFLVLMGNMLLFSESASERTLRLQLEQVRAELVQANVSLAQANADRRVLAANLAKLNADAVAGAKVFKKSIDSVSQGTDVNFMQAAKEARDNAFLAQKTAMAARDSAQEIGKATTSLISSLIVGMLFVFLTLVTVLVFGLLNVRSAASADRKTFLGMMDQQRRDVLEVMGETKRAMADLKIRINGRLSELLLVSNEAALARGTLIGHAEERAENLVVEGNKFKDDKEG